MKSEIKISELQRKCLEVLVSHFEEDANCLYLRYVAKKANVSYREARIAVRALARKGLAEYHRGLFDDDGKTAGSGYSATDTGSAFINPCDDCGNVISFDWEEEGKRIKLCDYCYRKRNLKKI